MKIRKSLGGLVCALLVAVNSPHLKAESILQNKPSSFGNYSVTYSEKNSHYLEIDDNNSSFSFRVIDKNSDNKADLIRLMDDKHDMTFIKRDFTLEDSIREVQLFDTANQFLEYFFSQQEQSFPEEKYRGYMKLVRQRFFTGKPSKQKINYDFSKFFSEKFQSQKTIEDLIQYTYQKYNRLIRETKASNPEQTFQNLLENSSLGDKINFWILAWNLANNINQLGYKPERDPSVHRDYLELDFLDEGRRGEEKPYFKIEMNLDSVPDSVNVLEIKNFLNGKDTSMFKYDKDWNYLYGGFRCEKEKE